MKKRILASLLAAALLLGLLPMQVFATVTMTDNGYSKVLSKREYAVVPGVTETDLILNNDAGTAQNKGYVMEVDVSNPDITIIAGYKDYNGSSFGLQTTTKQAEVAERVRQRTDANAHVVGAVNGGFFNMSTGETVGAMVLNGTIAHPTAAGWPYFAILKDGTPAIRSGDVPLDDVQEAMGGSTILVKNGQNLYEGTGDDYADTDQPRTAIGIKADGTVVMFVCDGRQAPNSLGMSFEELAGTMLGLGCVDAMNLDGGGSTTFITEREGTGVRSIKNSPSDGFERLVSGTLLVLSTAAPSGTFDHASLSAEGSVYTPGSTVQLTAVGVDAAGGAAELPADVSWALAADSAALGSIDAATGVFTGAENAQGTVNVQLISGGAVVGTTSIELRAPDALSFNNPTVYLNYKEESNLGLIATYGGVEVIFKDGDFNWSIADATAGSFAGNTFTASENNAERNLSVETTVTVASSWDSSVTGSVIVGVGMAPKVVMDGGEEDGDGLNYANVAYVHANANGGGLAYETHEDDHGNVIVVHYINGDGSSRGGVASGEQVDIDSGEVRFGKYAFRLDYDFTNTNGIEGACVGFDHDITIEGNPSGIGVWVYAPENTANLWVRIRVKDGAGTTQTLNFTQIPSAALNANGSYGGIDWVGWKYLECDLSAVQGPITLMGGETIRIMHTNGGAQQAGANICQLDASGNVVCGPEYVNKTSGYLYLDNLQLVYGTNNADTDNPNITKLQAGSSLEAAADLAADGSTVVNSNEVTFYSEFADVQNDNTTGVELAYIYVDGVNMTENENCAASISDGKLMLNAMKLANGTHSVKMLVRDGYGNEAVVTRSFVVDGEDTSLTAVNLEQLSETAPLGDTFGLALTTNNLADVNGVDAEVSISEGYEVTGVEFAEGFAGSTWSYDAAAHTLKLQAVRSAEAAEGAAAGTIATITVAVPADAAVNAAPRYRVTSGEVTYATEKDASVVNTFATATVTIPLEAAYTVSVGTMLVGAENGTITVTDRNGAPAAGAEVYLAGAEDTLLGTTDANGTLTTAALCGEVKAFSIYAKGADGYSFIVKGQSFAPAEAENAEPYYIIENIAADGSTMQNISWMASPAYAAQAAKIRYGTAADSLTETADGSCQLKSFAGSGVVANNRAVLINSVLLSGLTPDTTYYYQVGDGNAWSAVRSFTTVSDDTAKTTSFFVLGDTQTAVGERENITTINGMLGQKDYAFGVQTGDAVETPALYSDWTGFLDVFSTGALSQTNILHAVGNHEQFADEGATGANAIFNTAGDYYSAEYGNVYAATMSYTEDRAELQAFAAWLQEDAAKSDAAWKILVMHHSPYYTNASNDIAAVNEIIAPAVDAAGIDMVFSGHDHSYARTEPMTGGEVDEKFGAVYFICGSTGEKSYAVTNNPDFHFAIANQDYDALYFSVDATEEELAVTVYNVLGDNADIYDSYIMKKYRCPNDEHSFLYNRENGDMVCSECGYQQNATETKYSDFVRDAETGRLMNLIAGVPQTGFKYIDTVGYNFDDDGLAYEGEYEMCGETVSFKDGQYVEGSNENVLLAGRAGNNADFIVTADGLLYVDGIGELYAHSTYGSVQWKAVRNDVKALRIGAGITKLGSFGFSDLFQLEEVYIEEGSQLANCPNYCFANDYSLKALILPDTVKTIGFRAITGCKNLEFMYLPAGITYIGDYAFDGCSALTLSVLRNTKASSYAERNSINALYRNNNEEHSWTEWTNYTCADNDYTGYRYCTTCGVVEQRYGLANGFEDVAESDYYYNAVLWAAANKVVYGTSETTFAPGKGCTRAEIVAFLYRAAGCPTPESTETAFTDIDPEAYYYDAVLWASENGIVYGTSETTFAPNKTCTRAETVAFLYRAAGCPTPESTETAFTDIDPEAYYYVAVLWATENGIVYGTSDTTFAPAKTCTRAQVVAFLYRAEGAPEV